MVADFHVRHLALEGEANDQGAKLLRGKVPALLSERASGVAEGALALRLRSEAGQCIFMQL